MYEMDIRIHAVVTSHVAGKGGNFDCRRLPTINTGTAKTHYENMPMQYTAFFHGCKNDNFQMKKVDNFLIFAQNIDRGYTIYVLEQK